MWRTETETNTWRRKGGGAAAAAAKVTTKEEEEKSPQIRHFRENTVKHGQVA